MDRHVWVRRTLDQFFLDSSGRICGYDQGVQEKPVLMYYNPLACLDTGLPGEGQGPPDERTNISNVSSEVNV